VNALIRSRRSWNSGPATLRSIAANTASNAAPQKADIDPGPRSGQLPTVQGELVIGDGLRRWANRLSGQVMMVYAAYR